MRQERRSLYCFAVLGTVALGILSEILGATSVGSQPSRVMKVVVPFPPGGGVDIVARLLADQISRTQKVTFVVENRPGAGTMIATEAVARAPADGNTILFVANSFIINPALRKVAYDPVSSFEPVCLLTRSPNVIVVNDSSPYRSLTDFLNDARAKPGQLQMAFQGPATGQHIGTEKLKRVAKVDLVNVPFPGAAPAANALSGGHVTALFVNFPSVASQVISGKTRVLATAARSRSETLPEVPTIAEIVGSDFEEDVWTGSVIPAKSPKAAAEQIGKWMQETLSTQEVRSKLALHGFNAAGTCGTEFGNFLREQFTDYSRVITATAMRAE